MLLKAPIHNLTLSLICRFEVNCLHINPIIGEILLIYINFQQKFPYFSSYDNFYCIEICLPTAYFTSSRCVLKRGFLKFGLFFSKHPAGFHCCKRPSPTFTNIWSHCPWALQSAATVIINTLKSHFRTGGQDLLSHSHLCFKLAFKHDVV